MALPKYPLQWQIYILSLKSLQPIKAGALTAYPNATAQHSDRTLCTL